MERLDAPPVEQRPAHLVQGRQDQRDPAVGDHVAVEVEANAQALGQPVSGVERARRVAPDHQHHSPPAMPNRPQHVLFGGQALDAGLQRGVVQESLDHRPLLAADDDQPAFSPGRVFHDRQQRRGPKVHIAADLLRGQPLGEGPLGRDDHRGGNERHLGAAGRQVEARGEKQRGNAIHQVAEHGRSLLLWIQVPRVRLDRREWLVVSG